eukprot:6878430-Prymnesium_polylepis.1
MARLPLVACAAFKVRRATRNRVHPVCRDPRGSSWASDPHEIARSVEFRLSHSDCSCTHRYTGVVDKRERVGHNACTARTLHAHHRVLGTRRCDQYRLILTGSSQNDSTGAYVERRADAKFAAAE